MLTYWPDIVTVATDWFPLGSELNNTGTASVARVGGRNKQNRLRCNKKQAQNLCIGA